MVKEASFYKLLLKLALPIALQSVISLGVVMLDNIMVGVLGDTALSAVAQANQVTVFFTFFIRGVSGGASILISQYWGKKDMERIKSVYAIIMQICIVVSSGVLLFVFFYPKLTMSIFTNETLLIDEARVYLTTVCFSFVLYAISETLAAMLRCVEIVKLTLYVSIISLFTNLFFNYAFILGNFGFPALGIKGAAIATVIARAVELTIVLIYFFLVQKRVDMKVKDMFRFDKLMWIDFIKYGLPILIGDIQWGLVGVFKAIIIGRLGIQMIAANSITETMMSLGMIFCSGLATAACVIVGKEVGVKKYDRARQYSNTIQIVFVGVGILMGLMLFLSRGMFVNLYSVIPETKALAMQLLAIGSVTLIGSSYHVACFTGINRGAGDSHFVFKVDMICGWLIILPLSALAAFVFKFPMPIIFLCTKIDQCFKWIIALIRLKGIKWIHNIVRE